MKKAVYLIVVLVVIPFLSNAQRWKHERWSVVAGIGTNQFMGDLGGGKKDAAHFLGLRDMDMKNTRTTVQVGMRYRILEELNVRPTISYAMLKGDDQLSGALSRKARNLNFHSNIWEAGAQFEYYFLTEKDPARYTFSSLRSKKKLGLYVILGGGGLYYNPKGRLGDGSWVALRPMNNEGQGQTYSFMNESGNDTTITVKPYGKFTWFVSMGLGMKYTLTKDFSIGLEITNRYTGTDYLDDAHDRYFNTANNPYADPHIANETIGVPSARYPNGQAHRGDPKYNDAYVFTVITGYYKLKNTIKSMPKYRH